MTKSKILLTVFMGLVALAMVSSCNKDESKNNLENKEIELSSRTSTPSTVNGMLYFDNYILFQQYIKELETSEQDTNQIKTAYTQLGVDLTQEFLPNLTDYPVTLRKEQQISGFTSARKVEETAINNALNNGDESVFSIISEPFLKSALNSDNSVKIGTRIFKFYPNGGLAIVLNNDWNKYNSITSNCYSNLKQSGNLIVTNDNQASWGRLYNYDTDGRVTTEKNYTDPPVTNAESPLACDFSDQLKATNLNNGIIRLELPGTNTFDIYEWTFSDGTKAYGNPLDIDCKQKPSGTVTLDVWVLDPTVPNGKRRICRGTISFVCQCGEKKSKDGQEKWTNAGGSGKSVRIDATIFVADNQIGCRSRHFGKNFAGIWVPMNLIFNTSGIFANITGSFQRQVSTGNCIIVNQPFNEKQHPGGNNASWQNIISQPGINFMDPNKLSSGHRLRLRKGDQPLGTFFGFGVDRPRLILN